MLFNSETEKENKKSKTKGMMSMSVFEKQGSWDLSQLISDLLEIFL